MIEVSNLTKDYGDLKAVDRVSFKVANGETMVLIGTSGCGKTTILRMINRLIEPTHGTVYINGINIGDQDPVELRRKMGYVIQDVGLFPHYTVQQNISTVPRLLKMEPDTIKLRVQEYMDRLKIPHAQYADKYPHELSGGQQQRVGLARALAADPPIILMDEPFGALDPITKREIRQDFKELEELSSKTTVLVTHDILEAIELADKICVLDKGKLQQVGSPKDLIFQPANDFVKSFISGRLLELELHVIKLKDLVKSFPDHTHSPQKETIDFSPEDSLMKVLTTLISIPPEASLGSVQFDDARKVFSMSVLMERFHKFTKA